MKLKHVKLASLFFTLIPLVCFIMFSKLTFISVLNSVCFSVLSLIVCFILSIVSRRGATICPRFVLLDSVNSFWRCFSISSVAVLTCSVTLAITSSKRAC